MREKFMFFQNFMDTANKLPDDMRLKYYDAIMDYVFNGNEPSDPILAALINSIKPSLDKEETRGGNHNPTGQNQYKEVKSGQTGQNWSKGGQSGQSFLETETETRSIETEVIEKEKIKEKVAVAPRFQKPTLEEVREYVASQGIVIDCQAFLDFYESKGWKVGSTPMKDWKAAVRNWARRDRRNESHVAEPKTETIDDIIERMKREEQHERAV